MRGEQGWRESRVEGGPGGGRAGWRESRGGGKAGWRESRGGGEQGGGRAEVGRAGLGESHGGGRAGWGRAGVEVVCTGFFWASARSLPPPSLGAQCGLLSRCNSPHGLPREDTVLTNVQEKKKLSLLIDSVATDSRACIPYF